MYYPRSSRIVMEEITWFYILVVAGIFLSACSQLLLKKSADKEHKNFIQSMLNWRVILAYAIFFGSLLINITAMGKGVQLKDMPILESLGYIFVPLLSYLVLKEEITKRALASMALILLGIYIFYL